MQLIASYLIWILYSVFEGKREAFYFSYKVRSAIDHKVDEHAMFTIQRMFVAILICLVCFNGWLDCILLLFSLMMCFPFFHDGSYYLTRKKLDGIYPKGWFDQSTTSTAITDKLKLFYPATRTITLVVSLGIVIYEIIKNWK